MPILEYKIKLDSFKSKFSNKKSDISSLSLLINIFVIFLICLLFFIIAAQRKIKDKFTTAMANNPSFQDGQMSFEYLTNPSYSNNILNTYYNRNMIRDSYPLRYKNGRGYFGASVFNNTDLINNKEVYKTYKVQI
jgi:hypothetical protein